MAVLAATLAVSLAGCVSKANSAGDSPTTEAPAGEACPYKKDSSSEDSFVGLPSSNEADAASMELSTSAGPITVEFDEEQAPCTVESIAFLARKGFYDDTTCHRLTAYASLKVLQCGDPLGTGGGGPGYTIPDELPTDLPAGEPLQTGEETVIYGRGLVAMANAGPDTGGSQFFLVYDDSTLTPDYTVFGRIDSAGLTALDEIAAGGITPGSMGTEDGEPVTKVTVESAEVS